MSLVIAYDFEDDLVLLLLLLGCRVSGYKSESYGLAKKIVTSPCMPTKFLGLSFSSSIIDC